MIEWVLPGWDLSKATGHGSVIDAGLAREGQSRHGAVEVTLPLNDDCEQGLRSSQGSCQYGGSLERCRSSFEGVFLTLTLGNSDLTRASCGLARSTLAVRPQLMGEIC